MKDKNGNSIYDEDDEYIFDDHWLTEKEIRDSESDIIVTMGEWKLIYFVSSCTAQRRNGGLI